MRIKSLSCELRASFYLIRQSNCHEAETTRRQMNQRFSAGGPRRKGQQAVARLTSPTIRETRPRPRRGADARRAAPSTATEGDKCRVDVGPREAWAVGGDGGGTAPIKPGWQPLKRLKDNMTT